MILVWTGNVAVGDNLKLHDSPTQHHLKQLYEGLSHTTSDSFRFSGFKQSNEETCKDNIREMHGHESTRIWISY